MKLDTLRRPAIALLCALPFALVGHAAMNTNAAHSATGQEDGGEGAMADMMAKMAKYTRPGEKHEVLKRFLGAWDTEIRFTMGGPMSPPAKGRSECTWLHEGRWIQSKWTSPMMGMTIEGTSLMGYDLFKQSFVSTTVTTMDTAMNHNEGDLNQAGDVLLLYGTIDEYLDGQHDKMSKTVYRFLSEDEIVMEVHDFTIGEENTMVVQVTYKRAK